jgi:ubiquinone/menaquinone biosynthesis C-methylase UbiE
LWVDKNDLEKDKNFYDNQAARLRKMTPVDLKEMFRSERDIFQAEIFEQYNSILLNNVSPDSKVLELGAGIGRQSEIIYGISKNNFWINDISLESLLINKKLHPDVNILPGDMSSINTPGGFFDFIVSCGSLSYADPLLLNNEIFRILKPGGKLLILDSFNHNLIYRYNRYLKVFLGKRTKNSVLRIPDKSRILSVAEKFYKNEIYYFGSWLWLTKPLSLLVGVKWSLKLNSLLQHHLPSNFMSFKFILFVSDFKGSSD